MKYLELIRNRLYNTRGETITETLFAALLVTLAILAFSSMVILSGRIIIQNDEKFQQIYQNINAIEARSSHTTTTNVQIELSDPMSTITVPVTLYYTSDPDLTLYIKQ